MARTMKSKVSRRVREALEAVGDYDLKHGKRHIKITVGGKFVGIAPSCVSGDGQIGGNGERNVVASIKRAGRSS